MSGSLKEPEGRLEFVVTAAASASLFAKGAHLGVVEELRLPPNVAEAIEEVETSADQEEKDKSEDKPDPPRGR